ncbi:hypothetical protein [Thermosyntropha sp.]|uniref:GltB/FmdC/FwdC-like GXGXG domain-containing protein n=1 Tax=Thermosyntropha sp. TaxID=2740820 RepID=UPI0025CF2A78|nr:hypothetical protein [Thermosyntropha sp.]MBO8159105.1 hypothetical protein [Thermosyntropha sp.]
MAVFIDGDKKHFRQLNGMIKEALSSDKNAVINNVNGQRYIAAGLEGDFDIVINGVPGNDLGIFMDGPFIRVYGNVQDGAANTMNGGALAVYGSAGDIICYGMRGGSVYVRDNVGYRAGVHMKEFGEKKPVLVIGGTAGDFLGEYMAGGIIILINRQDAWRPAGYFCASGMHGGVIYMRGNVEVGRDVRVESLGERDKEVLTFHLEVYKSLFEINLENVKIDEFNKIISTGNRPYKKLYAGI